MRVKVILLNILGISVLPFALSSPETDYASENGIYFRFYNGTSIDDYSNIHPEDLALLANILNENSKPTAFYIHGYSESVDSESVKLVVTGYLKRQDHNVIAIDWREISKTMYINNARLVKPVGNSIAALLDIMFSNGFDIKRVHVIAHSMGAQVSSYIGRALNSSLPRITGLDPAGPLFNVLLPQLTKSDARFVDLIHTDSGVYGTLSGRGSVDFFPNEGHRIQPGCPQKFSPFSNDDFCSHHRSYKYYAESLTDEEAFIGVECASKIMFTLGQCVNNEQAPMGFATSDKIKEGSYYLTTNSQEPFGLKTKGIIA